MYRRMGKPQGSSVQGRKILLLPRFDSGPSSPSRFAITGALNRFTHPHLYPCLREYLILLIKSHSCKPQISPTVLLSAFYGSTRLILFTTVCLLSLIRARLIQFTTLDFFLRSVLIICPFLRPRYPKFSLSFRSPDKILSAIRAPCTSYTVFLHTVRLLNMGLSAIFCRCFPLNHKYSSVFGSPRCGRPRHV